MKWDKCAKEIKLDEFPRGEPVKQGNPDRGSFVFSLHLSNEAAGVNPDLHYGTFPDYATSLMPDGHSCPFCRSLKLQRGKIPALCRTSSPLGLV